MRGYFSRRYAALNYPDFRTFIIGQGISAIGSQMQLVALNWHIYELTHSAAALGLIGLMRFIPILTFALFGGAVADSFNRKKLLYVTGTCLAILATILAIVTLNGSVTPVYIYILTMLSASIVAFEMPARHAFIPRLIPKEHLANGMSLNVIMWQVAQIAGPAIAGIIISKAGVGMVYAINAASYFAIIIGLWMVKTSGSHEQAGRAALSFQAVLDGFKFVKSKTVLWSTMILDFVSTFFSAAQTIMPIFAKDILHVGPEGLGMLYSAQSIGALIAGAVVAHIGTYNKQGKLLLSGVAVYAIATMIFGLSSIFWLSLAAMALVGAGDSVSTIIRVTLRQLETPDNMRGRMTSINSIFSFGGPQLGEFEAGMLASFIGAPLSVFFGGALTLGFVIYLSYFSPALRNYTSYKHDPETPVQ